VPQKPILVAYKELDLSDPWRRGLQASSSYEAAFIGLQRSRPPEITGRVRTPPTATVRDAEADSGLKFGSTPAPGDQHRPLRCAVARTSQV